MKKIFVILVCLLILTGCNNSSAIKFKESYESINNQESKSGKKHRAVTISKDNPFEEVSSDEIVKKIENKETFYVYFGDKLCPWCRSVIEKFIEVAHDNKIDKVYYVPIWNDDGEEILRDKYELNNGEIKKVIDGNKNYAKLLEAFDSLLSEYNLTDADGNKVSTGEKRIYAPNFIYVKDGVAIKLTSGISELQTDSREELTKEILEDEEKQFKDFFKKDN